MERTQEAMAIAGIGRFLEGRGIELAEGGWAWDGRPGYVGVDRRDDGALVFVAFEVAEDRGEGFPDERVDRRLLERAAVDYLAQHEEAPSGRFRFDYVTALVVGEGRAVVRHHRDVLGDPD